eukprot:gb/GECH01012591.1/.p1 GENE.gb/GECH01012591.1/~~gb/GECH01012591.1/.p1  ORF type:complete len:288 (+),score=62.46 gb/GECH01012591.1/:1-864(+)
MAPQEKKDKEGGVGQHLIAGALAGALDASVLHPLERVKLRKQLYRSESILQATKNIYSRGILGFTEGIGPAIALSATKVGVRYLSAETFKKVFGGGEANPKPMMAFGMGLFAGITESLLIVVPFEFLKVQQAHLSETVGQRVGIFGIIGNTWRTRGIIGFYQNGSSATLLRQASNQAIRFPIYYFGCNFVEQRADRKLHPLEKGCIGGLAGAISVFFNTPTDAVKTVAQASHERLTMMNAAKQIVRDAGVLGLWRGTSMRLPFVTLSQFITWFGYSACYSLLDNVMK